MVDIWVGPKVNDNCPQTERRDAQRRGENGHREEGNVKIEAKTGLVL